MGNRRSRAEIIFVEVVAGNVSAGSRRAKFTVQRRIAARFQKISSAHNMPPCIEKKRDGLYDRIRPFIDGSLKLEPCSKLHSAEIVSRVLHRAKSRVSGPP